MPPEQHTKDDCIQNDNIARIQLVQDGTIRELAGIKESLIKIETTLAGKVSVYDRHVDDGERWRSDMFKLLLGACLTGFSATVGFGIWVGGLSTQIHVNTDRLAVVESRIK